jgi:DNA-binding transcriptional LysR family regulator
LPRNTRHPKGTILPQLLGKTVSLRAIEVFEEIARTGSLQDAAHNLDLSAPAASQQLKKLEVALGQTLVDHGRRPLTLTRAGRAYLVHVRDAMAQLRYGSTALSLMDMTSLRRLRLGIIDDFDTDVTPKLTVRLASVLTQCDLSLQTAPSHAILQSIGDRSLDIGIAARPLEVPAGITETPLLRDPFVLIVPRGHLEGPPSRLDALQDLPFLRYDRSQVMGRQIATHLTRLKLQPQGRVELDSNQAIFGLIAAGAGWAISTPLGFLRARRFQGQIDIYPLPFTGFSRVISLFRPSDWTDEVARIIATMLRDLLLAEAVDPGLEVFPWLDQSLTILQDEA